MNRNISVNLELNNKKRFDGRSLIMIRLSEKRKHVRFSLGISVYASNFVQKNDIGRYITESEFQYNYKNKKIVSHLFNAKSKIKTSLLLNPKLTLIELKVTICNCLISKSIIPNLRLIQAQSEKNNDMLTYTTCNFLYCYIELIFGGIDYCYEHLTRENFEHIRTIMIKNNVSENYVMKSISILKSLKNKIVVN